MRKNSKQKIEAVLILFVFFGIYLTAGLILLNSAGYISPENEIRSGLAMDLLRGNELGREGLICSLWWAPLPSLLILVMSPFRSFIASGGAGILVSSAGGGLMLMYLFKSLRYLGASRTASYLLLPVIAFNPWMLLASSSGNSEALLLGLFSGAVYCLLIWYREGRLTGLSGTGILISLMPLVKHEALVLAIVILAGAMLTCLTKKPMSFRRFEGTSSLVLFPLLYTVGLWFLFNWLIMGDFLHFLRGVYISPVTPELTSEFRTLRGIVTTLPAPLSGWNWVTPFFAQFSVMPFVAAAVAVALLMLIWKRGIMPVVFLAMFGVMPLYHVFMMSRNQSFNIMEDMLFVLPLSAVTAGYFIHHARAMQKGATVGVTAGLILLMATGTVGSYAFVMTGGKEMPLVATGSYPFFAPANPSQEELEIKQLIYSDVPNPRIALVGFHGYSFLRRAHGGENFVHTINLDLPLLDRNTLGKELLIIVPKPAGRAAFDDINIERPELFRKGEVVKGSSGLRLHFRLWNNSFANWHIFTIERPKPDDLPLVDSVRLGTGE